MRRPSNWPGLPALRALCDCHVVRACPTNPSYATLAREGLAEFHQRRVGDRWVYDYRLTTHGWLVADGLPPLPGGTKQC